MIVHAVRCDQCKAEKALRFSHYGPNMSTLSAEPYGVPEPFMSVDNRHFCGYPCLAAYAEARANQPKGEQP